ncbi:hypothetical protein D6D54_04170 [Spiroplasma poulsonii]|uniref:Uncharacterized protein n=1 Tax=Spiroplasma poulsonii TaxID=2138 RepID=A0A3S0TY67_9MOLU|nr:hypothetical protein [Spiroplasma poulsonii]MBW3058706.1 hypothetical protein [Spiroplasma poulsonii]RUP77147.1 hypothetical protein D6D54_04170 [Spiroplasma poulsonii]
MLLQLILVAGNPLVLSSILSTIGLTISLTTSFFSLSLRPFKALSILSIKSLELEIESIISDND